MMTANPGESAGSAVQNTANEKIFEFPKFGQNLENSERRCSGPTQRLDKRLGTIVPHIMTDYSGESGGCAVQKTARAKIFEFPKLRILKIRISRDRVHNLQNA